MKKTLTYWFIMISLLAGIISINVFNNRTNSTELNPSRLQSSAVLKSESYSLRASDYKWLYQESNQVQAVDFAHSNISRLIPDTTNLRTTRHKQLALQQLYSYNILLYSLLSYRQINGYFLFFLCKILI